MIELLRFSEISLLDLPASFICSLRSFNFLSSSDSLGFDSSFSRGIDFTPGSRGMDLTSDSRGMDLGWNLSTLSCERGVSIASGDRGVSMLGEEGESS